MDLAATIRDVPNFPKDGILFKDITTLLKDAKAFRYAINALTDKFKGKDIDVIVAMEARGFIIAAPLAYNLGVAFVPIRKPGRLPMETISVEYSLEYGTNTLEVHKDAISPGQKVLVVDDLLATGGTVTATIQLVEQLGGEIVATTFIIELTDLNGRDKLKGYPVEALIQC